MRILRQNVFLKMSLSFPLLLLSSPSPPFPSPRSVDAVAVFSCSRRRGELTVLCTNVNIDDKLFAFSLLLIERTGFTFSLVWKVTSFLWPYFFLPFISPFPSIRSFPFLFPLLSLLFPSSSLSFPPSFHRSLQIS